ncbi:MAG TPA: helix-turn-helix domain-containing protein [Pseudonocardia sp.]|jgi:AraC-like DNA-binding protein
MPEPEPEPEPDWAVRRPHPALRALVSRYVGYRQHGVTLEVHRGLPGQHITLIISLNDPVRLLDMPGSAQRPDHWQGFVAGLHAGPALIAQDRDQAGVHLDVSPLGVRTLLGVSARELAGRVVDLAELPRPELAELPERLRAASGWATRFALVDRALLAAARLADRRAEPVGEVGWAWRRLVDAGGAVTVQRLADDVGWSRRHFAEKFAGEVGLSPKQAARVVRFGRATDLLRRMPPGGLAETAARCGYFDQAHLSNEFRALAGCSPRTWLIEELPFLHDSGMPGEPG